MGSDLAPETVKAFTYHLGKWVRSEFKKSDGDTVTQGSKDKQWPKEKRKKKYRKTL